MTSAHQRNRIRLLTRDLAAGAAFASMAVSGQIPLWACGLFALGLVLALTQRRLLSRRGGLAVVVLGLAGLSLYGGVAAGFFDLVVAACSFAGFITLHRLLSTPAPATDSQVYLTSLLMIAGGAALSGELSFALFLMAFAALASVSLGLSVVQEAMPEGAELPLRPLMRQLSWGVLAAVLGSIAFFVLFPRLSWNVAARRVTPGLGSATAGFSDRVRLGGDGSIKKNPRIVARITLHPDPGGDALNAYWIGRTYDSFKGDEWTGTGEVKKASGQVKFRSGVKGPVLQTIELLPAYGSRTLVIMDPPVLVGGAMAHSPSGNTRTSLVEVEGEEVRFEVAALGYTYHAYSSPKGAREEGLANNPDTFTPMASRYLTLPQALDPRVAELARTVAGGETDRLKAAHKLETYLKTNYGYTLELSGDVADPLADFLFTRKEGHCEHFATALAVMLRTLKIPARVASGFYGGERVGGQYVLRAGDAHAWTQVLVPGTGWVTLDATPEASRAGQPAAWLDWLTRQYEAIDSLWRAGVVDYTFQDQARMVRNLVRPPRSSQEKERRLLPPARVLIPVGVGVIVLYALFRFRRWRPASARERAVGQATALLDAVEKLLGDAGVERAPDEGLEELAARLQRGADPLGEPLGRITRRYLEARFGNRPLADGERATLLAGLRGALAAQASARLRKSA
jgi:hypothetical protein